MTYIIYFCLISMHFNFFAYLICFQGIALFSIYLVYQRIFPMVSYYFEILILSFIQGFSEFIPVSSSAHLIIVSNISNFDLQSLEIDISLHLGSLIAILFYFRKDLITVFENKNLASLLIIGSLPLIAVGYFLYQTGLIDHLRNIKIIAWTTLIFGVLLYFADKFKVNKKIEKDLKIKNILFIGLFQILALVPGVSRSGITITACRFLNFNRYEASKISFYLSIPALAGASILGLKDIMDKDYELNSLLFFSTLFSFIFSYLTIKFILIYVKNYSLNVFVYYRIFLAFMLLIIIYN